MHRPALVRVVPIFVLVIASLLVWTHPASAQAADSTGASPHTAKAGDSPSHIDAAAPEQEENTSHDGGGTAGKDGGSFAGGGGGEATSAPPLTTFATDPDLTGALANSVNLHSGDVNLPVTLVSLPGRGGLDVTVSALYSSNVHRQVDTWNVEAPTGILGLGWSLGYDRVIVDHKNTGTRTDDEFYLVTSGATLPLVLVEKITPSEWRFESTSYRFWDIRYYTASEKWVVTREDGMRHEFGVRDSASECSASATHTRNAVEWAIKWGNFIGDSSRPGGQECLAVAWNLRSVTNLWGESVDYYYSVDRERVGNGQGTQGSLEYTKASYLDKIVGPDGRAIHFTYGSKCDGAGSGDCQGTSSRAEFVDPHSDPQRSEPDAYQERFESRYLDQVEVKSGNTVLTSVAFAYDFMGTG